MQNFFSGSKKDVNLSVQPYHNSFWSCRQMKQNITSLAKSPASKTTGGQIFVFYRATETVLHGRDLIAILLFSLFREFFKDFLP